MKGYSKTSMKSSGKLNDKQTAMCKPAPRPIGSVNAKDGTAYVKI